jgi:hypothetical protein
MVAVVRKGLTKRRLEMVEDTITEKHRRRTKDEVETVADG